MLRKWNSSERLVLQVIHPMLLESIQVHSISGLKWLHLTIGLEWDTATNTFHVMIFKLLLSETVIKRILISDIVKAFDVLGWLAPATISMEILL